MDIKDGYWRIRQWSIALAVMVGLTLCAWGAAVLGIGGL